MSKIFQHQSVCVLILKKRGCKHIPTCCYFHNGQIPPTSVIEFKVTIRSYQLLRTTGVLSLLACFSLLVIEYELTFICVGSFIYN